uniref:Uncharacterized protein n=1 Tax=Panagrolaimus sp. ES5 TaxID=591445 RepID=A0AC34FRY9_9BILA
MSEIEERFLRLPDSEDYTRVRQFNIDKKGVVICILGQSGAGKSSLISQFITSEYRNAFADEVEVCDNTVSVAIGGAECELFFMEYDPNNTDQWKHEEVQAYVLMYSIDSKSSFRTITNVMEDLRIERSNIPIILAGNKVDLERKRAIAASEVRTISHQFGVAHFEISVALNHEVNELLIGIVAEIKNAFKATQDFQAAIRRFSQRKKKQMGVATVETDSKCANLSPQGLFAKLRHWRRGSGTKC